MATDDLRAELYRLEKLPAGAGRTAERVEYLRRRAIHFRLNMLAPVGEQYEAIAFWLLESDDELARLRAEVAALHAQLQKQAYVVPEGSQLVVPPHVGRVGYVLVRGGHVVVQEGTP